MPIQFFLAVDSRTRQCRVLTCPMPFDELRQYSDLDERDFSHRCVTGGVCTGISRTLQTLRRDYTGRKFSPDEPIQFSCGKRRFFAAEIWELD